MTFGLGFLTWEKVMNFKIFPILNIVLVWGWGGRDLFLFDGFFHIQISSFIKQKLWSSTVRESIFGVESKQEFDILLSTV